MDGQQTILQVDQPNFRDRVPRVERKFDIAIVCKTGIGDFDKKQDVVRARVACTVEILARLEDRDIRCRVTRFSFGSPIVCLEIR